MLKAMKEVTMDLLFGDGFPEPKHVVSDDPDYLETLDEINELFQIIYDGMTDDECEIIADLLAQKDLANGYQLITYFHEGLISGFLLRDKIKGDAHEKDIINLIFN